MSPAASQAFFGSLVALALILGYRAITRAQQTFTDAIADLHPYPTEADALALKWAHIAEDFTPDEFELLRRADRQMAGVEAAVIRDWQRLPYDQEADQ